MSELSGREEDALSLSQSLINNASEEDDSGQEREQPYVHTLSLY